MKGLSLLEARLNNQNRNGLGRTLSLCSGLDFSSNDYLGFSTDPALLQVVQARCLSLPLGATGSRLLRGNLALHQTVESNLADFCGSQAALLFPSGYQANLGLLSALLTKDDTVFSDAHNHASLVDGIRLSRAQKQIFAHGDLAHLESLLQTKSDSTGLRIIVTESLFSMDGDFAPLEKIAALAQQYQALLIVDESHTTGVYGDFSKNLAGGLVQELGLRDSVLATIHTGGKALGTGGAWIAGSQLLIDYLIQCSRPFIYSTAVIPGLAAALDAAVNYWKTVGLSRAKNLRRRAQSALTHFDCRRSHILDQGIRLPKVPSCILPVIVGSSQRTLALSRHLQEQGYDVRAIRPPTVPEGSARIRITLQHGQTESDWQRFLTVLFQALEGSEDLQ